MLPMGVRHAADRDMLWYALVFDAYHWYDQSRSDYAD